MDEKLFSSITIKPSENGSGTEVYVDGHKLGDVQSYKIEHKAGEIPVLTLDINAYSRKVTEPKCIVKLRRREHIVNIIAYIAGVIAGALILCIL